MKTPLYDRHIALKAKIVDFNGWEMPIQYNKGIIHEHNVVRNAVGIFDVSHMGRISVEGLDAEVFLDYISTNVIKGKENKTATYTVLANNEGGAVDDVLIYKIDNTHFFLIVNAGNRKKDLDHIKQASRRYNVTITDHFQNEGILAIQGPLAMPLIKKLFPTAASLSSFHFTTVEFEKRSIILSHTGYTGAGGYELYAPQDIIINLWDVLLCDGQHYNIEPIGLGARDTLRLEMGYALYGHELSDVISPIESVSAWTVKPKGRDFLGKAAIEQLIDNSKQRYAYGIILLEQGIAREGYFVVKGSQQIGIVTSGTFSPTLNKAIALILVNTRLDNGETLEVIVRGNKVKAQITPLPFLKHKEPL